MHCCLSLLVMYWAMQHSSKGSMVGARGLTFGQCCQHAVDAGVKPKCLGSQSHLSAAYALLKNAGQYSTRGCSVLALLQCRLLQLLLTDRRAT